MFSDNPNNRSKCAFSCECIVKENSIEFSGENFIGDFYKIEDMVDIEYDITGVLKSEDRIKNLTEGSYHLFFCGEVEFLPIGWQGEEYEVAVMWDEISIASF